MHKSLEPGLLVFHSLTVLPTYCTYESSANASNSAVKFTIIIIIIIIIINIILAVVVVIIIVILIIA